MPRAKIGPSILNADLANLQTECQKLLDAGGDFLHLDVMDGHFVPNISIGAPVVKCLRARLPGAFLDVHLMVSEPEMWITDMSHAGADIFTFHFEATDDVGGCIEKVKTAGMKVGIAIKPATAVDDVIPFLDQIDLVLVMTVEPGFGGQSFMEETMAKVKYLRRLRPEMDIEVDGGIGPANIDVVGQAGANMVVSGSAIIKSDHQHDTISRMRTLVEKGLTKNST